jgi:preprotein translocase subunit SecG
MSTAYDLVVLGSAIVVSLLVLIQTRGASLGAGFGGGGEINTVRRGSDKTLHQITIIAVLVFVMSIIASIVA